MRFVSLVIVSVAIFAPLIWYYEIAATQGDLSALFSQYIGSAALIAMAISMVIATRARFLAVFLGPLDWQYLLHRWLSAASMIAILLHDTIDAEMEGLGRETALVDIAETVGEVSLYGLLILVTLSVATFIPYHIWRWTHKLMGAFYVFSVFHYVFILKPFENFDPLGVYILAFCALGTFCYLYTLAPFERRGSRPYRVTSVAETGGAVAVTMTPEGKSFTHKVGQFAFIKFDFPGLEEPHAFTISSEPRKEGSIRFTIKALGDYTTRLAETLEEAMRQNKVMARVEGPFGGFHPGISNKAELWVGAGVGITPFISAAEALPSDGSGKGTLIHLFYAYRGIEEAPHLDHLRALAAEKEVLTLVEIDTSFDKRLTADLILESLGGARPHGFFCGPAGLLSSLKDGFTKAGVRQSFHAEAFEIRTDLGLGRAGSWIGRRVGKAAAKLIGRKEFEARA